MNKEENCNVKKKKIQWWKWILGILLFPAVPFYLIIKSKKFKVYQKVLMCLAYFVALIIASSFVRSKNPTEINLKNIETTVYKEQEAEIELVLTPEDSHSTYIECEVSDNSIAEIYKEDGKFIVRGVERGDTDYVCKLDSSSDDNAVQSEKGIIHVIFTEEQQKQYDEEQAQKEYEEKYSLSMSEMKMFRDYSIEKINSLLKAPSTASYPGSFIDGYDGWTILKNGNYVTVYSYVDAQNSFGSYIRTDFMLQFTKQDEDTWGNTYIDFGGETQGQLVIPES